MTVREYRLELGWSISRLARESGLATRTVSRIEDGEPAYDYVVATLARTFSNALGQKITIDDLEGVNIIGRS